MPHNDRMGKKKLLVIPVVLLLTVLLASSAFAAADGAGNIFSNDKAVTGETADRDLYWAGLDTEITGGAFGGDGVLAGKSISVSDCTFGGSLRAAGYSIDVKNTLVPNNITAAGYTINIGEGVSAAGLYATGSEVAFSGECEHLQAFGKAVTINGVVTGDAYVHAASVIIGENAVIKGTLSVEASAAPDIPAGAKVGKLEFTPNHDAEKAAAAAAVTAGAIIVGKLLSLAYWLPAMLVLCVLLWLLFSKELDGAGKLLVKRPVAMPITGLVSIIAFPVAIAILCLTFIGLPSAGILLLIALVVAFVSVAFAGASAGRLVFPKMHKLLSSIIGVAVLVVLQQIPVLGTIVLLASMIYTVGYLILVCFERIKSLKNPAPAAQNAAK